MLDLPGSFSPKQEALKRILFLKEMEKDVNDEMINMKRS